MLYMCSVVVYGVILYVLYGVVVFSVILYVVCMRCGVVCIV